MKISFVPLADERAASSRIRVFSMHRALRESGIDSTIGYDHGADIVYIQKKVTKEILCLAIKAKILGKTVVYDVDDFGEALDYCCSPRCFRIITDLADLITTDTQGHQQYLAEHYGKSNVVLVPDTIDYYPERFVRWPQKDESPLRVLWFGGISNVPMFEKYIAELTKLDDIRLVVITSLDKELENRYPHIEFVPWSLSTFIETLQRCHVSCLMHDGSDIDVAKSNNKMITSITWGVPAIVSATPEYLRCARESGVGFAVFHGIDELAVVIDNLRTAQQRLRYLDLAQEEIWERYCGKAVARQLLQYLQDARRAARNRSRASLLTDLAIIVGKNLWFELVGTLNMKRDSA